MLAAVLCFREEHGRRGIAAPDIVLSGRRYRNKRRFDAKSTGAARDTAYPWKRFGAPDAPVQRSQARQAPGQLRKQRLVLG